MSLSYSAVYLRPDGRIAADWIRYDTARAALLGPTSNQYVGQRVGHIERVACGPPRLVSEFMLAAVELRI